MHQVMVATGASHARYGIAAIAVCSAALWFVGDARASEASSPGSASDTLFETAPETGGYVEEVIVTADRLEKGAMPSQTIIVQTYSVLRRGKGRAIAPLRAAHLRFGVRYVLELAIQGRHSRQRDRHPGR